VLLIHNDFDESFRLRSGRYMQSFLRLEVENGRVKGEIAPVPYQPSVVDWVSQSAIIGYLVHRQRINIGLNYVSRLIFGGGSQRNFEANIDAGQTKALMESIAGVADFTFAAFSDLAAETGIDVVLVMDGHRDAIYEGRGTEPASTTVLQLNSVAAATASRYDLPFLDLHSAFWTDWQANERSFNFENDGHWNLYGHELVAEEIHTFLMDQGLLDGRVQPAAD
jgi:hypothetical protein